MAIDFYFIAINIYQYIFTSIGKNNTAKFNIEQIVLIYSRGFNASEIKKIGKLIEENKIFF